MCEKDKSAVRRLVALRYSEHHALEYVRRRGRCTYCGVDLVADRHGFATLRWEHLLPKGQYPQFEDNPENILLACYLCNDLKGIYDPSAGQPKLLKTNKVQLIENARAHIGEQKARADVEWRRVRSILFQLDGWPEDVS